MSRKPVITASRWKAGVANSQNTAVKAVFLGTSTTQGGNATDHGRRYHEIMRGKLSRDYNLSRYTKYYNIQADQSASYSSKFTYTDGSGSHSFANEGLSLRTVTLTNGASMSITVTSTAITLLFVQGSAYGAISMTVDGNTTTLPTDARSGDHHDGQYTISGSYGSHTVTVAAPVSGSVKITGVIADDYGDLSKGIQFYNSGHGGFSTTDFVGATYLYDRIASISPQLVFMMFGTNDYGASMSISTFTSNCNSIIASVKAVVPNADLVFVCPYRRLDLTATPSWTTYRAAMASIAAANNCFYIDLTDYYPDPASKDSADLIDTDNLHQTDAGHSYMAKLLYSAFV